MTTYTVQPLPYATDALAAKGMSRETVELHYRKHHAGYAVKLTAMAKAAPAKFAGKSVADVVRTAGPGAPYNMAAQIYNHDFFWQSLTPVAAKTNAAAAAPALSRLLQQAFGSYAKFAAAFTAAAATHFGSGWAWLVYDRAARTARVVGTHDAVCPLSLEGGNLVPLLVCDVWEHAYYVDYRNDRPAFVANFWKLANWEFAEANYAAALAAAGTRSKL
jgi:Fe-Mn family superoxide dismutase